jgi:type I restriction enzyme S subunit
MLSLKNQFDMFNGEGTVFGCINKDNLHGLKLVIPPNDIIEKYEKICNPMDTEIHCLCHENLELSTIRDTLLPKLMSGEIEVEKSKGNPDNDS